MTYCSGGYAGPFSGGTALHYEHGHMRWLKIFSRKNEGENGCQIRSSAVNWNKAHWNTESGLRVAELYCSDGCSYINYDPSPQFASSTTENGGFQGPRNTSCSQRSTVTLKDGGTLVGTFHQGDDCGH